MRSHCVVSLLCACHVALVNAGVFLGANRSGVVESVSAERVEQSLLAGLAASLEGRRSIASIEQELRPMYAALPKGAHGNLESSTVRYALHRYFVHRHGWYVKGLEPAGKAWSDLSSKSFSKDRVPEYILGLFDRHLGNGGLGLRELAVFAATLEDLVHQETAESLGAAYEALKLPRRGSITQEQLGRAVATHALFLIDGGNLSDISAPAHQPALAAEVLDRYPAWPDMATWIDDMRRSVEHSERHRRNPFADGSVDFAGALHVLEETTERFGSFQASECHSLKDTLVEREHRGTGRVRLQDFWPNPEDAEETWQFTESLSYLRELGALDETDPKRPSVVIPNYINSHTNCLTSSGFLSICCRDECEGLLGHLEREVGAPSAEPRRIAELVSNLPSDTVVAPRNLSAALLGRLADIAAHHGGRVPLHGRLFSQWMHHAYPRECVFPQLGGITNPRTADEWMAVTGKDACVSNEELKETKLSKLGDEAGPVDTAPEATAEPLPWLAAEELVGGGRPGLTSTLPRSSGRAVLQGTLVLAVASVVAATGRTSWAAPAATGNFEKHLV